MKKPKREPEYPTVPCRNCGGTCYVHGKLCKICKGSGVCFVVPTEKVL